jgi:riboflavin kinase/FMN adenylyltransferase
MMQIINGLEQVNTKRATAVTIGTFDGVHTGHRKIITEVIRLAKLEKLISTIITFEPHPRTVIKNSGPDTMKLLTTLPEKTDILQKLDIDQLIIIPFTPEFAETEYQNFVKNILIEKIRASWMVVGHDHTFGKNRKGNFEALQQLSRQYPFRLREIGPYQYEGQNVSSSRIRDLLLIGNVEKASLMLGYSYAMLGQVVRGDGRGSRLAFPTANLQLSDQHKLIPANGVYAVECLVRGRNYRGMANIGVKPTFGGNTQTIEVHLFDFSDIIYGESIHISYLRRLREEIKFKNETELVRQLQQDKIDSFQN